MIHRVLGYHLPCEASSRKQESTTVGPHTGGSQLPLLDRLIEAVPAWSSGTGINRPVDEHRLPQNMLLADRSQEAAVQALFPVVTQDEIGVGRHGDRPEVITDVAGHAGVSMLYVGFGQGSVIHRDHLMTNFDPIARDPDHAVEKECPFLVWIAIDNDITAL